MKYFVLMLAIMAMLAGCSSHKDAFAYGTFSADATYPASEVNGRITYIKGQGEKVAAGDIIALLDTTDVQLQIKEAEETIKLKRLAAGSRDSEIAVLEQEKANLEIDKERFEKLRAAEATAEKNLDDILAALRVMDLRIRQAGEARKISRQEIQLTEVKMEQLKALKAKHFLRAPVSGTILEKYNSAGEMAVAGKPYCKLADLTRMTAKVYVSETQLPLLKLGEMVLLTIDGSDGSLTIQGAEISHIAAEAEFTPKIIQTRDERVKLVYEVQVECPNDGMIKIGMPVEMYLPDQLHGK
ncbi:MAG: HlyD family efflux transporter periplasmic adaptor subunit [Candidatus Cloacimonetes bacterium]|nr:HlyD family efflux transporter periplasmic adaptor subunit [Candidatus Cloacimonadota bacterium]